MIVTLYCKCNLSSIEYVVSKRSHDPTDIFFAITGRFVKNVINMTELSVEYACSLDYYYCSWAKIKKSVGVNTVFFFWFKRYGELIKNCLDGPRSGLISPVTQTVSIPTSTI